jgi:hypothetical protein
MQPILESYGDLDRYRSMVTGYLIRAENEERQRFQAGECIAVVPGLKRDVARCPTQDRDLTSKVFWEQRRIALETNAANLLPSGRNQPERPSAVPDMSNFPTTRIC